MTGESLSSYYEEQKGGKKVEIERGKRAGQEMGRERSERVALSLRPRGDEEGWEKRGKEPVLFGIGRKERTKARRVRLFVLTRIYFPVRGMTSSEG